MTDGINLQVGEPPLIPPTEKDIPPMFFVTIKYLTTKGHWHTCLQIEPYDNYCNTSAQTVQVQ